MNVTMADVAREAGVSLGLVSRAFKGSYGVSEANRAKILDTAHRMGYQPNSVASRLASKANTTLGVFLLDLHNEVYIDMYDGIREAAERDGRELVITTGSTRGDFGKHALDSLTRARVDVAIAAGLLIPDSVMNQFRGRLRLVSVARVVEGFDAIDSNNFIGATSATEHLLRLGHRRIVHLAAPPSDGYGGRPRGYEETMKTAGLAPRQIVCDYARSAATETAMELLRSPERPTAIFAHNDQVALGVLDALHYLGLKAPDDLSVVGYDNTSASAPPNVNLTTVDLHARELGRRATEMAIQRSQDPTAAPMVQTTTPTLVVRSSTGSPAC